MSPALTASPFLRFLTVAVLGVALACSETTTPIPPIVPTKLVFTVQPASTTAARPLSPAVTVEIQDANGNLVTTATNSITLALATSVGTSTLWGGTTTVAAVNGVATFSDLSIAIAATGYTLSASSPNLAGATSNPFAVVAGSPVRLEFIVQPVSTIARTPIPTFSVALQDLTGNTVTTAPPTNIALSLGSTSAVGAFLMGTTFALTVNGVATFSGVSLSHPGTGFVISARTAQTSNLRQAQSAAFNQTVGPSAKLVIIDQPVATSPGGVMSEVAVAIEDAAGNPIRTATNSITLSIGTNPAGGSLSGTTTVAAVNGVARFSDLRIDNAGAGYSLSATAANLTSATSTTFSIRNPLVFTTVTAGYFHSCGLASSGIAYCWGQNSHRQLGYLATFDSRAPEPVSGGLLFSKVNAGRDHNCGVTTGGIAYCWGGDGGSKLGAGASEGGVFPVAVLGGLTFAAVSGGRDHTCGVTTAGAGYCWGANSMGELGNGTLSQSNVPTPVSGGLGFKSISSGRNFSCGMTTGDVAYCWGINDNGELGDGTTTAARSSPARVSGSLNFATVSAGGFHACGLTSDGVAHCWGLNSVGQLGTGEPGGSRSNPAAVGGGHTFAMITAGNRHTCGVTTAGAAYCWGESGYLGNGSTGSSAIPVAVAGGLTFASVTAGRFHSCGVTTAGAAYCWGENSGGWLGDGTRVARLAPVPVR